MFSIDGWRGLNIWQVPTIRSPIWRYGLGMAPWQRAGSIPWASSCKSKNTPMSSAGPTRSARAPPCSAGARSTARGASFQINCTSVMTPVISKQRLRTSLEMAKLRPADDSAVIRNLRSAHRRLIRDRPAEHVRLHGQHAVSHAALDHLDGVFLAGTQRNQQGQEGLVGGMRAPGVRRTAPIIRERLYVSFLYMPAHPSREFARVRGVD